jgi:hypothetical protein
VLLGLAGAALLGLLAWAVRTRRPAVPVRWRRRRPAVTTRPDSSAVWTVDRARRALAVLERVGDPTLTAIGVFTLEIPLRPGPLSVHARTEESFLRNWTRLAGVGGGDARARQRRDHALSQAGAPL